MTNEDYQKILHEVKNDVTFISSSLQLLEKLHPDIKVYDYWNDAMQEIASLKTMLIELSSARLCDIVDTQTISTEIFLIRFVNACNSMYSESSFRCELQINSRLPKLHADTARLKRALSNLLKNSYEAMQGNGIVNLQARRQADMIRLDLIDHGGGIPSEYLSKLFTPFETTKANGTGLGLLITRQIIEAHGGHLTVESRPQDGCTFSVFLPCVPQS